jgi:hypothetical protein
MNTMNKRRPERKQLYDERKITFADIKMQQSAQVILREQSINYRVSGLSLFVFAGSERRALVILNKAGLNPVEPIIKKIGENLQED